MKTSRINYGRLAKDRERLQHILFPEAALYIEDYLRYQGYSTPHEIFVLMHLPNISEDEQESLNSLMREYLSEEKIGWYNEFLNNIEIPEELKHYL